MKDKIAIITGGTSGIGYSTANRLAKDGAIVYAAARNVLRWKKNTAAPAVRCSII